jgi:exosome complex component RRP42
LTAKDISKNADGSARITLGDTTVLAGLKFDLSTPYPDSPDKGGLATGVELTPAGDPEFETGPPREKAIELARVVDRCIREAKTFDFKKLCLVEGEAVLFVYMDFYVIDNGGNLFDACSIAGLAALTNAQLPKIEDNKIIRKEYSGKLKLDSKPLLTSFAKIGNTVLLDPGLEEDKALEARFHCGTTEDERLCAFQKGANGSFTEKEILDCCELSLKQSKKIRKLL